MSECIYNEKYFDVDGNRVTMKIIPEECILETDDKTIITFPDFITGVRGEIDFVSYNHNGLVGIFETTRHKSSFSKSLYVISTLPVSIDTGQFNIAEVAGDLDLTEFNFSKLSSNMLRFALNVRGTLRLNKTLTVNSVTSLFKYAKIGKIDFGGAKISGDCTGIFSNSEIGIIDLQTADLSEWKTIIDNSKCTIEELGKSHFNMFNKASINAIKIDSENQLGLSLAEVRTLFGVDNIKGLDYIGANK